MQINIQEGTRKTAINFLKTIRQQIDVNLKYFCGEFAISDYGYPKRFFSAVTTEYICYKIRYASNAILNMICLL
ncbi:hypothetical protein EAG08_00985 [Chryseobacterium sp. 3008163]|nr:hypothetical protein EAG08_00985 [Chryseobacterium sp. 3008163]